eukprot:3194042-Pleurochrysis_carterae.AAC.1
MTIVGEIKENSAEAKEQRKARRGATMAFVREYDVGSRNVTLLASGHNQKVPLLLICTGMSMLPGDAHAKVWTTSNAEGELQFHKIATPQPQAHALYKKWMNVVDLHALYRNVRVPGLALEAD